MATDNLLDFEALLRPISEESPSGEDLKWDSVYEEIKTARKTQGNAGGLTDEGAEETPPNWLLVLDLATTALSTRTKDLMISAWLIEALISLHGFAGCRDGFKLMNDLLDQFWDTVYPLIPEDGDLEVRVAPLAWCSMADKGGRLPILLRQSPLIPSTGSDVFTWNYWESSFRPKPKGNSESDDLFAARKEKSEERVKTYQEAMRGASRDTIQNLADDLAGALAEINRFSDIAQQRFARLSPGVSDLRKALDDCTGIAERALKEKSGSEPAAEATAGTSPQPGPPNAGTGVSLPAGAIQSRQDAFNRLDEIAKYLRQVEPHSPVSYLVQRAVKWGRMPFDEVLQELLKDTTVLAQVGDLLGIKKQEE